ncbi:MAG: hypothetical protein AB7G17_11095 [Phycisphaerales bacterium]
MRSDRIALVALAATTILTGCARTLSESSAVDAHANDDGAFWTALESQRTLTNHDALHGLFLLADGADTHATYEERVASARDRQWISAKEPNPVANESISVGRVASAAARIAEIKGGLSMRLAGPTPRYATRELVYMGLLPDRTENQSMSGLEFLDLIGRMEDHMAAEEARSLEERLQEAASEPAEAAPEEGTGAQPAANQEEATPPQGA